MAYEQSKILIVDDEKVVCDLLYSELSERGYSCSMTFNGTDALAMLATGDFDLVLLDIKLPGISGIEVLRRIQSSGIDATTIIITAIVDVGTAVQAMKLGALDYIVKPFKIDRVERCVHAILTNRPQKRQFETQFSVGSTVGEGQADLEFYDKMNSIARGVEAKHDMLSGHSRVVTETTIDIAWRLGIPEKEIKKWRAAREKLEYEGNRAIESLLDRFARSIFVQYKMGMTKPYRYVQNHGEYQN
jgi:CheY-like chemotaxis protein